MSKFYGKIGYGEPVETPPGSGNYPLIICEQNAYGEVIRNSVKLESGEGTNDDLSVNNSISIVSDQYANEHFQNIKYVKWRGAYWTVTTVTPAYPRLVLRLGSVYNGLKA